MRKSFAQYYASVKLNYILTVQECDATVDARPYRTLGS